MDLGKKIPSAVIRRLPRYYRYICNLLQMGISRISSRDLGKRMDITPSQVRQDFYNFGGFGQQGYGYDVDTLHRGLWKILSPEEGFQMIVIGAGNLGQALVKHSEFEKFGYKVIGVFDNNSKLIGEKIRDIPIQHLSSLPEFIKQNRVDIAALTVPSAYAYDVAQTVIGCGINALWNFAPVDLKVPKDVVLEDIHMIDSLMVLGYRLKEQRSRKLNSTLAEEQRGCGTGEEN